ncbi:MAG: ABC transporter ATP-binding protein [Armatimonadota bacterium]|nr:ABC transporter ATP-binding protein [Armatimonadota bacterium]MDR5697887.1 ABC transporter ATP-binding protein [Armatimonadota bacterium]
MTQTLLELRGISKRFPGVVANDDISLRVERGEIHAIVGENGAGKSTLMKILYGLYQPDEGEILIRGRPVRMAGPRTALMLGIGMVHQHFMLIPAFTVAENVILGSEPSGVLSRREAERRVRELSDRYGFRLDPSAPVSSLSVGEQQRVEILKVLYRGAELLILDEPTAVLTPQEVEDLFRNLRGLREGGKTIIFISHKLDEVLALADRVSVLRRGRMIGTVQAGQTDETRLAEMMVGRPVLMRLERPQVAAGEPRLEADRLRVLGTRGRVAVRDVSFAVRSGEIYAIAGVEGNGQTELVEALVGLRPIAGGSLRICGADATHLDAREIRMLGTAHIPEDRHRRGLVLPMEMRENVILGHHVRPVFGRGFVLDDRAVDAFAQQKIHEYDIRVTSTRTPVLAMSGGNQQKVVVAREFAFEPRVLVAAQPTRGLDIGATEFVSGKVLEAKAQGMAVVLVSSDLDEALALGDRIGVMFGGELVGEFSAEAVTASELGLYMTGARRQEAGT